MGCSFSSVFFASFSPSLCFHPVSFSGISSKRLFALLVTLNFNFNSSRLCTSIFPLPDTLRITLPFTSFILSNSYLSAHPLFFLPQISACASPIQSKALCVTINAESLALTRTLTNQTLQDSFLIVALVIDTLVEAWYHIGRGQRPAAARTPMLLAKLRKSPSCSGCPSLLVSPV